MIIPFSAYYPPPVKNISDHIELSLNTIYDSDKKFPPFVKGRGLNRINLANPVKSFESCYFFNSDDL